MGLDRTVIDLLISSKHLGVDYSNVCTLGRQKLHESFSLAVSRLRAFGENAAASHFSETAKRDDRFHQATTLLESLSDGQVTALDNSSYEGADLIYDLNAPVPKELESRFSALIDGGTIEHVFDFPNAIRNSMRMIQPGGHFIGISYANNQMGHGFYQFSPELAFRVFAPENGFTDTRVYLVEQPDDGTWFEIRDPKDVGKRVILKNHRPTYLLIVSRKNHECTPFASTPQQSDYSSRWENFVNGQSTLTTRSPKNLYQKLIPLPLREKIHIFREDRRRPLTGESFKKIKHP